MTTKVSLVLDDDVKQALDELIPAGERSHFANEALRGELKVVRKRHASERLEALRRVGPHVPTTEILLTLRSFRDTG